VTLKYTSRVRCSGDKVRLCRWYCVRLEPHGRHNGHRQRLPALRAPTAGRAAGRVPSGIYLTTSSSFAPSPPKNTRKHKTGGSDSIRSKGFEKDHGFNVRWLRAARRVLKADGTLWVTGTHHIIFSLGFALQRLGFRIINNIVWSKPNATLDALHTPSSTKRRWHSAPQEPPRVRYPYRVAFHAHQRLLQVAGAHTWDAP
jgi:DNA methylase